MRRQSRAQMDLFATPAQPGELTGPERQMAVALLQALLTEATTEPADELKTGGRKGVTNE